MQIELFADVVCPWCYIGSERLARVLARRGAEATVLHRPFLLSPDTPREGADLRDELRRKYGADPEAMFARVEAVARDAGIPLDFSAVRRTFPTLAAHTLLRRAGAARRDLVSALYRAYFLEGRDIGDAGTLAEIGVAHGLEAGEVRRTVADDAELAATRAEVDEAYRIGVTGVPLFVFDRKLAISGAQPERVFDGVLDRLAG